MNAGIVMIAPCLISEDLHFKDMEHVGEDHLIPWVREMGNKLCGYQIS
jgi:hypothetical protein